MVRFIRENFMIIVAGLAGAVMVVLPQPAALGAKAAIGIWLNSVVPSLLPFFIISDYIRSWGAFDRLPLKSCGFLTAVFSGYPMGARVVAALVEDGVVDYVQGRKLLALMLVTGPAFILGTVGDMLGSAAAARIILISHYGGAALNGLVSGAYGVKDRSMLKKNRVESIEKCKVGSFSASAKAGLLTMGMILSYLMLFMIAISVMEYEGVFSFLGNQVSEAMAKGLLEMTAGMSALGSCHVSMELKAILGAMLVSFGGFSVICQSVLMMDGIDIKFIDVVKIKIRHGFFGGIIAVILTDFMI